MMPDSLEARRKKLIYVANHRGMKETDVIVGGFATAHAARLTADQIGRLEALMEVSDNDLLNWLTGRQPVPKAHDTDVFAMIKAYREAM